MTALLLFDDAWAAVRGVMILVAVSHAISSLQLVAGRQVFASGGLLDWTFVRQRRRVRRSPLRLLAGLQDDAAIIIGVVAVRLAAALVLLHAAWEGTNSTTALAVLAVANAWLAVRGLGRGTPGRLESVWCGALLGALLVGTAFAAQAALLFIATVTCFAYISAGAAKIRDGQWGDGTFLQALAATRFWGGEYRSAWARKAPKATRTLERAIVVAELLFPLVLVLPAPWAATALAIAALGHAALAATLGLNLFFWAFVATYPALMFVNAMLARVIYTATQVN